MLSLTAELVVLILVIGELIVLLFEPYFFAVPQIGSDLVEVVVGARVGYVLRVG